MKFNVYKDVKAFYRDTCELFMRHEAQNLIPLGNIIMGNKGEDKTEWRDPANWFMAAVTGDTGIVLSAIMTPPYNLTLYATDNIIDRDAINCLIDGITAAGYSLPGVMTEKTLALSFAEMYSARKGITFSVQMNQRIYVLEKVNADITLTGTLRAASEADMSFIPYWAEGFNDDCFAKGLKVKPDAAHYLHLINGKNLFVLEDRGTAVSMAMIHREMRTVCGVSEVYTPPYFRGKGYATSCVAGVSRIGLERGFTKCALYTDLANPVSNSIYQKIGYRPICDSVEIKFDQ